MPAGPSSYRSSTAESGPLMPHVLSYLFILSVHSSIFNIDFFLFGSVLFDFSRWPIVSFCASENWAQVPRFDISGVMLAILF